MAQTPASQPPENRRELPYQWRYLQTLASDAPLSEMDERDLGKLLVTAQRGDLDGARALRSALTLAPDLFGPVEIALMGQQSCGEMHYPGVEAVVANLLGQYTEAARGDGAARKWLKASLGARRTPRGFSRGTAGDLFVHVDVYCERVRALWSGLNGEREALYRLDPALAEPWMRPEPLLDVIALPPKPPVQRLVADLLRQAHAPNKVIEETVKKMVAGIRGHRGKQG